MTLLSMRPYKRPKPIDPTAEKSRFGIGYLQPDQYTELNIKNATAEGEVGATNGSQFSTFKADDFYFYFLSPIERGIVTFRNQDGIVGGWDGASWPLDDIGETYGPVIVTYNRKKYNLYRTDFTGLPPSTFTVSYENG